MYIDIHIYIYIYIQLYLYITHVRYETGVLSRPRTHNANEAALDKQRQQAVRQALDKRQTSVIQALDKRQTSVRQALDKRQTSSVRQVLDKQRQTSVRQFRQVALDKRQTSSVRQVPSKCRQICAETVPVETMLTDLRGNHVGRFTRTGSVRQVALDKQRHPSQVRGPQPASPSRSHKNCQNLKTKISIKTVKPLKQSNPYIYIYRYYYCYYYDYYYDITLYLSLSLYIYIYTLYIHIIYIYIYTHVYIQPSIRGPQPASPSRPAAPAPALPQSATSRDTLYVLSSNQRFSPWPQV